MLVAMTKDTCVKSSMAPQAYKVVRTYAHEISGWKILSRILYLRTSHIGGINGDIKYGLDTLEFKNGEKIEDFHSRISEFNRKLTSLEKLYLLQDLY